MNKQWPITEPDGPLVIIASTEFIQALKNSDLKFLIKQIKKLNFEILNRRLKKLTLNI